MCADVFRKGCPPVPGGSLDQTKVFIEACRLIWSEQDRHRISALGPLALLR